MHVCVLRQCSHLITSQRESYTHFAHRTIRTYEPLAYLYYFAVNNVGKLTDKHNEAG